MKHISELVSVKPSQFSPHELTKQQVQNDTRYNKRPQRKESKNIPKLVRAVIGHNGKVDYIHDGDGRARFKFKVWWKDEYKINGRNSNYGASADAYYKMINGEKFWYIDEKTAYQKLVHLALYTYRDKFKTFMIFINRKDFPLWSDHEYNLCIYKNCYNNEYKHHKGLEIPEFKFTKVESYATSEYNKQLKVDEFYLNMMHFDTFNHK